MAETRPEWDMLTNRVSAYYASAELRIIDYIAQRLYTGQGSPAWAVQRLAELETVRRHIASELGQAEGDVAALVDRILTEANAEGQAAALTDLEAAGLPTTLPAAVGRAVATIAMDTMAYLYAMRPVALRAVTDTYQHVIARASSSVALGAQTRVQATQDALMAFARHGITGFTDKSGRRWRLDSYAEMAVRTGAAHAMTIGHTDTLSSFGQRFVTVAGHGYACPLCTPWEGKVLSIDGTPAGKHLVPSAVVDEYVPVTVAATTAQAEAAGLHHPNCAHAYGLYLPGTNIPARVGKPTPVGGYEATQRQRAIEREIRKWKRVEAAAHTPEAKTAARARTRTWQKRRRELTAEFPDLVAKPRREQIKTAH